MGRSNKTFIEVFLYELMNCFILLLVQAKWLLNDWLKVWFEINGMIIGFSCREGSDRAFRKDCGKEIVKFLRNKVFPLFCSRLTFFKYCDFVILSCIHCSVTFVDFSSKVMDWITSGSSCLSIHSLVSSCSFPGFPCTKAITSLNFEHDFVNIDLGGFFPPRELLFSPVNFWIGFNEPRVSQNNLLHSQHSHQKLYILLPSFNFKVGGHVFPNRTVLVLHSIHVHYCNFFP